MSDKMREVDAAIADSIMENEYENLCDSGWGSNFELYKASWIKATSYATFAERERCALVCENEGIIDGFVVKDCACKESDICYNMPICRSVKAIRQGGAS